MVTRMVNLDGQHKVLQNQLARMIAKHSASIRAVVSILGEGSFFGDYQILLKLYSNFDYITSPEVETSCLSISENRFDKICH